MQSSGVDKGPIPGHWNPQFRPNSEVEARQEGDQYQTAAENPGKTSGMATPASRRSSVGNKEAASKLGQPNLQNVSFGYKVAGSKLSDSELEPMNQRSSIDNMQDISGSTGMNSLKASESHNNAVSGKAFSSNLLTKAPVKVNDIILLVQNNKPKEAFEAVLYGKIDLPENANEAMSQGRIFTAFSQHPSPYVKLTGELAMSQIYNHASQYLPPEQNTPEMRAQFKSLSNGLLDSCHNKFKNSIYTDSAMHEVTSTLKELNEQNVDPSEICKKVSQEYKDFQAFSLERLLSLNESSSYADPNLVKQLQNIAKMSEKDGVESRIYLKAQQALESNNVA